MASLNPNTLCQLFTLEQIEDKITFYSEQLDKAVTKSYMKDTTQGTQRVESADIDKIESILQAWLKAKECKNGGGGPNVVSANFRPIGGRIC